MITEIILGITLFMLVVSLYFCFKFARIILKVQETIEESLDILDERYKNMSEILQRPLFYDSPEVRSVLEDINYTRTAVHNVAVSLVNNFEANKDDER